jgi:feruloyl esterase
VQALLADSANYIPAAKLPAIEAAALNACDGNDGVKDGVIENPAQCHFDPSVLLCKGAESDSCLTEPQLATLKKIYSGPQDSKGKAMYVGYSPGGEPGGNGWGGWITGAGPGKSLQYAFGTNFFKYMVFENPDWDVKTFAVEHDLKVADDKVGQLLNATDANLKRFKDRGGKLIVYHGWSDAAIPPMNAIEYYKSVTTKMGAKQTESFVRLYMVPGMQHCAGGPGPSSFGQTSDVQSDAQHDINRAVEHWVEDGVAPAEIIAAKYKGQTAASGLVRTRPLCPYPQVAQWKGSGSTDDAANFVCK